MARPVKNESDKREIVVSIRITQSENDQLAALSKKLLRGKSSIIVEALYQSHLLTESNN